MELIKNGTSQNTTLVGSDFFEGLWEKSWTYIKTVVDVVREPMLVLDKNFRVLAANDPFYLMFQVEKKNTEGKIVYELGNGQWDIPSLRKLLEDILPQNTFFKGFEVTHDFPIIGRRVMILNARQIHFNDMNVNKLFPPIILLAMENVTEMMMVAETIAEHTKQLQTTFTQKIDDLERYTKKLEIEINALKRKS